MPLGRVRWSLAPGWDLFSPGEGTWLVLVLWADGLLSRTFQHWSLSQVGMLSPRTGRTTWEAWRPGGAQARVWSLWWVEPRLRCSTAPGLRKQQSQSAAPHVLCRRSCRGRCRRRSGVANRARSSLTKQRSCTRGCWSCLNPTWNGGAPRPMELRRPEPSSSFSGEV